MSFVSDPAGEYGDGARYDAENGAIDDSGRFFLALAERCGAQVLDLGCGTGRLAIPLARRGKNVTGLDGSPAMLGQAKAKAGDLPIRWVEGDFRSYDLGRCYDLIMACGHAFQALLTEADQLAFLRCARRHLADQGCLAFDTRNTAPVHLAVAAGERYWHNFTLPEGVVVDVSGTESYDAATGIMSYRSIRTRRDNQSRSATDLDIKFTAPAELRRLLRISGLQAEMMAGDFAGGPLTATAPEIVVIARADHAGQAGAGA